MNLSPPESRILVVAHHHLFRECLVNSMQARIPGLDVETAESTELGLEKGLNDRFQLVLFDADSPTPITPDQVRRFRTQQPDTQVVIVGKNREEHEVIEFLEAGATDFRLADSESLDDFCAAIKSVIAGSFVHDPDRTRALFARLQTLSAEVSRMQSIDTTILTKREMEILRLVDKGQSNKDIAKQLHLSLHTVKNHVHRILEKLQVSNRREAVHLAYNHGWLKLTTH